jgi:hypothetical protein
VRGSSGVRRAGSAALDLCHVANRLVRRLLGTVLAPWDVAAGTLIVREAGGVVTRSGRRRGRARPRLDPGRQPGHPHGARHADPRQRAPAVRTRHERHDLEEMTRSRIHGRVWRPRRRRAWLRAHPASSRSVVASPSPSSRSARASALGAWRRVPGLPVHRADLRLGAEAGDQDLRPRRQADRGAVRGAAHAHRDQHAAAARAAGVHRRRGQALLPPRRSRLPPPHHGEPAQRHQRRITGGGSTITQQLARNMFEEGIGFEQRARRAS